MTPDQRTLLLLAAEALRINIGYQQKEGPKHLHLLADALDRIAGAVKIGESTVTLSDSSHVYFAPDRFTPNSGRCWRCQEDNGDRVWLCDPCWERWESFQGGVGRYSDDRIRAWIEAEEARKGKP